MITLFRRAVKGASVQANSPYANSLGASNTIPAKGAVVGAYGLPSTVYQQPVTLPPRPVAGPKGILRDTAIVPSPGQTVPLFSPAGKVAI